LQPHHLDHFFQCRVQRGPHINRAVKLTHQMVQRAQPDYFALLRITNAPVLSLNLSVAEDGAIENKGAKRVGSIKPSENRGGAAGRCCGKEMLWHGGVVYHDRRIMP
jgi:hypothetical protein